MRSGNTSLRWKVERLRGGGEREGGASSPRHRRAVLGTCPGTTAKAVLVSLLSGQPATALFTGPVADTE